MRGTQEANYRKKARPCGFFAAITATAVMCFLMGAAFMWSAQGYTSIALRHLETSQPAAEPAWTQGRSVREEAGSSSEAQHQPEYSLSNSPPADATADSDNTAAGVAGIQGVLGDGTSIPAYVTVMEDFMPEDGYHQEGGFCQIGSKLYLVGGIGTTRENFRAKRAADETFDSKAAHVIDLDSLVITQLPDYPAVGNHLACAVSANGLIHVTGGFMPNTKHSWKRHWSLDTKDPEAKWVKRADLPQGRGSQGCAFLSDGKMYCTGGGSGQWGPFLPDLFIYDPETDSWTTGPEMHVGRDHVAVLPIMDGTRLMAVGGRSDIQRQDHAAPHPVHWQTMNTVEVFDPKSNTWVYTAGIPIVKAGPSVVALPRREGSEPNVLVIGGENHLGMSGIAYSSIEEYDIERGTWHCHAPLPFPIFGGAAAVWGGKLYVVAGGEWFGVAATRRLQIIDLATAPEPMPCAYLPQRMDKPWDRHYLKTRPWPGVLSQDAAANKFEKRVQENYGFVADTE